jgi:DNA repair ATPase RecN
MISAKQIDLEKFVVYDKATYEFTDGITMIRGGNRSGKSLIFSAWGNLLYGSPPIMNAKRQSKQMHVRSGSRTGFTFTSNGHEIQIIQGLTAKSVKYSILIDGQEQAGHRQADALELIRELVPAPEDLFYTSAYIAGARSNVLHQGTGVQRLNFLESMFDFENFDTLRARLQELLQESRKAVSEAEALKAELRTLPEGSYLSEAALLRLGIAVKKLSDDTASAQRAERAKGSIEALSKTLGAQRPAKEITDELSELKESSAKIQEKIRVTSKKAGDYARSISIRNNLDRVKDQFVKIKKPFRTSASKVEKLVAKLEREYAIAFRQFEESAAAEQDLGRISRLFEEAPKGAPSLKEFYDDPAGYISSLKRIVKSADALEGLHDVSNCPTCNSKLGPKHVPMLRKEAEKVVPIIEFLDQAKQFTYNPGLAAESSDRTREAKRLKTELSATKDKLANALRYDELKDEINKLEYMMPKGLDPEAAAEHKRLVASYNGLREKIKAAQAALEARLEIDRLTATMSAKAELPQSSVNTLISAYSSIKSESKIINKSEKRRRQIENRLTELGKAVEYEDLLTALVDAYGPRGLRVDQMESIAQVLEQSFNRFAPSIFPEPIFFNFGVSPSRAELAVERNAVNQSDAALMSGSEVACFKILCFAALSPYIPARYRFDAVVLDEVEAMMDPVTRQLFTKTAIPKIAASVRSLTLVTPLPESEFFIEDVRTVNVIKERSRSRLEIVS